MRIKLVYPSKFVPILKGNIRVDQVQVRVRGLFNFFDRGWGQRRVYHYPFHTYSRTRFNDKIIKILLITC